MEEKDRLNGTKGVDDNDGDGDKACIAAASDDAGAAADSIPAGR